MVFQPNWAQQGLFYKYGNENEKKSMTFVEAWVKDNGDGTFNFEVNFTAGGQKYYFTYDLDPTKE